MNEAWIRTGIGRAGAVLRLHPAGSTLPIMVLSGGAIAFLLFSTVSIRVLHSTPASPEAASGPNPVATASAVPITGSQGGVTGLGGSGNRQAIPPGLGGSSLATGPSLTGAGPNAASGSGNGTGQGRQRDQRRHWDRDQRRFRRREPPSAAARPRARRRRLRPRRRPRRRGPRPARRSPRTAGSA